MTASELLRSNDDICGWWVSVVHDRKFDQVIAFGRAKLSESTVTQEQMQGVNQFIKTLRNMTDNEENPTEFPSSGLIHDLSPQPKTKEEKKE